MFGLAIFLVVPASVKISDLIGDTYQAQIEATIEDAKNTQNILENSGVVDDTNATETTGTGTTEASGTVTGNVQEKEPTIIRLCLKYFRLGKRRYFRR